MDPTVNVRRLAGWVPISLYWQAGRPMLDWCYLGKERWVRPFWIESVEHLLQRPANQLFRQHTSIDVLADLAAQSEAVPPAGFIFHMSRCGSTLVSRMLATLPSTIVISEAGPIEALFSVRPGTPVVSEQQRIRWLQGLVHAFGQRRSETERSLVIKFDMWSAAELPLIRRAFPTVPWVFVYRDPVEVMVSQRRQRGSQMMPGLIDPGALDLDYPTLFGLDLDDYCARVLARVCRSAVAALPLGGGRLMGYSDLPDAALAPLLQFFGVEYTASDLDRMRQATQWHAKRPGERFAHDAATRQQQASPELQRLAEQWIGPVYRELQVIHAAQQPWT